MPLAKGWASEGNAVGSRKRKTQELHMWKHRQGRFIRERGGHVIDLKLQS